MDKKRQTTLSIQVRSTFTTVNANQIKSIIVLQNTRSVQEMELSMRNSSYLKFCTFLFQKQQKHDIKKAQKTLKNKKT